MLILMFTKLTGFIIKKRAAQTKCNKVRSVIEYINLQYDVIAALQTFFN